METKPIEMTKAELWRQLEEVQAKMDAALERAEQAERRERLLLGLIAEALAIDWMAEEERRSPAEVLEEMIDLFEDVDLSGTILWRDRQ